MGDSVVALWIAEGARSAGDEIAFVDSMHSPVVRAFGHAIVPHRSDDCMVLGSGSNTYEEELATSAVDRSPRTVRWQKTVGWDYPVIRPKLKSLSEDATNWARAMCDGRPMVVLAPKANFESRSMPLQKWLRLGWSLERAGYRTIAIDGRKEMVDAFPFYAFGFGWEHVVALLTQAAAVAGNDSSIPHIAATLGVPTIAAMGPTNDEIVFGHCRDTLTIVAAEGVECSGCHFRADKGYQVACDHGCDALQSISWTAMRYEIERLIAGQSGRSLIELNVRKEA